MQYDRTVIAYHGCDADVAERLLGGESFEPSENAYDWLGSGIYFWEWGIDRAWRFAQDQKERGKVDTPAVVGTIVQLGQCFDLMDTRFTHDLQEFYAPWALGVEQSGHKLPLNRGGGPDRKLRFLDCAVLNAYLQWAEDQRVAYDTVRCGFVEGETVYPNAGIHLESHVQLVVRNPNCIIGVFRPM